MTWILWTSVFNKCHFPNICELIFFFNSHYTACLVVSSVLICLVHDRQIVGCPVTLGEQDLQGRKDNIQHRLGAGTGPRGTSATVAWRKEAGEGGFKALHFLLPQEVVETWEISPVTHLPCVPRNISKDKELGRLRRQEGGWMKLVGMRAIWKGLGLARPHPLDPLIGWRGRPKIAEAVRTGKSFAAWSPFQVPPRAVIRIRQDDAI